jgi:uncharacterized protein (DUF2147 family)
MIIVKEKHFKEAATSRKFSITPEKLDILRDLNDFIYKITPELKKHYERLVNYSKANSDKTYNMNLNIKNLRQIIELLSQIK